MATLVLLRCSEPDGVLLSDSAGNLKDLRKDLTTAEPLSAPAWSGPGRRFTAASSSAVIATDRFGYNSLTTRDATVQAIISLTKAGAGPWTIYARGTANGTPEESTSLGLRLTDTGSGLVGVSLFWGDASGAYTYVAGPVSYRHTSDSDFVLITATRRWDSPTSVACRFFVGEQFLGEVVSANGDIPGGIDGTTMIGGRKVGAVWSGFYNGVIDEISVHDFEMTPDEITETWRRLAVYQLQGEQMFAGLSPPGAGFATDPSSVLGRLSRVAGQVLGTAISTVEGLRALFLPDACDSQDLERWEKICGIRTSTSGTTEERRARVIGHLARDAGYAPEDIKAAMSVMLDADIADLDILQFSNTTVENWDTLSTQRWRVDSGTWSVAANRLSGSIAGSDAADYSISRTLFDVRLPLTSKKGQLARVTGSVESSAVAEAHLGGIMIYDGISGDALWFGVIRQLGTNNLGWIRYHANAGSYATTLVGGITAPVKLKIDRLPPGYFVGGTNPTRLSWSVDGGTTWSHYDVDGIDRVYWAGYAFVRERGAAGATSSAVFGPMTIHEHFGTRPFWWYVYRPDALGGSPDFPGAKALADRIRPAHTIGGVAGVLSVLCDDAANGRCNYGPMGGL